MAKFLYSVAQSSLECSHHGGLYSSAVAQFTYHSTSLLYCCISHGSMEPQTVLLGFKIQPTRSNGHVTLWLSGLFHLILPKTFAACQYSHSICPSTNSMDSGANGKVQQNITTRTCDIDTGLGTHRLCAEFERVSSRDTKPKCHYGRQCHS